MASRPPRDTVRSDVLAQATVAFEKEGYARASLARIAADADYTKGAIYSSFGSKAELHEAFTQRRVDFLVTLFVTNARLATLDRDLLRRASVIGLTVGNALAVEHLLSPETVDRAAVRGSIRGLLAAVLGS